MSKAKVSTVRLQYYNELETLGRTKKKRKQSIVLKTCKQYNGVRMTAPCLPPRKYTLC